MKQIKKEIKGDRNKAALLKFSDKIAQDRQNYLGLYRQVYMADKNIEWKERLIANRQKQLFDEIIEKDGFGNPLSKEELEISIEMDKENLETMKLKRLFVLEDLFTFLNARSNNFPKLVEDHYKKIREFGKRWKV